MKALFTLLFIVPAILNAQTAAEWQLQHPNGVLVSQSTYSTLSAKERSLLGDEVFIFDSDISEAEQLMSTMRRTDQPVSAEAEAVKTWLAYHQDIPVISYSDFIAASEIEKELLTSRHALIFKGEKLTLKDIENYHY